MALATQELLWLKGIIKDIDDSCIREPIELCSDSQSAIKLVYSNNYHARSKHIDIKHKFIKENVSDKVIELNYVSSKEMIADALTKAVTSDKNIFCNQGMNLVN